MTTRPISDLVTVELKEVGGAGVADKTPCQHENGSAMQGKNGKRGSWRAALCIAVEKALQARQIYVSQKLKQTQPVPRGV